jgi:hypothetical protein
MLKQVAEKSHPAVMLRSLPRRAGTKDIAVAVPEAPLDRYQNSQRNIRRL